MDEEEDDEEDDDDEEEEEDEDEEVEGEVRSYHSRFSPSFSLMTGLALPPQRIDPSAILGRRTRGKRIDYASEEAYHRAGLGPEGKDDGVGPR
ncbi:hypothetical protein F5888DRAFT_1741799 [Russula emetica]|nr:hypothetical protein F5888DRAFT_1741799 [Russula emetica]